ncbi:response regulator transcription factor [Actinoplanes xinjiangensis]|uniref:response regulator transcription factor n=1 Tax=Actinoplanes xinjiangensis TaxID=512350 RepID=UPI00343C9E0C
MILVAEDDADIAQLLRRLFERAGFEVVEAGDGSAALAGARTRRPDVVVTDLDMPVLDGLGLCRALRGDPLAGPRAAVAAPPTTVSAAGRRRSTSVPGITATAAAPERRAG